MTYPEKYRFTKEHEWVDVDGETATVGITPYAAEALGDIVFVELPAVDASFDQSQSFGTIESVKAVSDVYAPVSGVVTAGNELLATNPEKVNEDPLHEGWLIKLKLTVPGQADSLMTSAQYEAYLAEQK